MHFSLILIGAHDGSKTEALVSQATAAGKVLLVEPVPFLFERLSKKYHGHTNVMIQSVCISTVDGPIDFISPLESANTVVSYGDQLGSVVEKHASNHNPQLSEHIKTITVQSKTFQTLVSENSITSIDMLMTDTEGLDLDILPTFPFHQIMPARIVFEFKHSDGTNRIGLKLANYLIQLDKLGYEVTVLDIENLFAFRKPS